MALLLVQAMIQYLAPLPQLAVELAELMLAVTGATAVLAAVADHQVAQTVQGVLETLHLLPPLKAAMVALEAVQLALDLLLEAVAGHRL